MPETTTRLSSLDETIKRLNLPQYATSPHYESAQAQLAGVGGGLLRGDIPNYYKPIGEYGGSLFEDILRGTTADITRAVTEDVARRGGRGGLAAAVISREVGRATKGLRFEDMLRAIEGRKGLLGLGTEMMTGVRGAGLQEAGQRGTFELAQASMGLGAEEFEKTFGFSKEKFAQEMAFREKQLEWEKQKYAKEQEEAEKARKGSMWQSIIGGLGTVAGMALAPATGGLSLLGSAAIKGTSSIPSSFTAKSTGFGQGALDIFG